MKKIVLTFGLISGVILSTLMVIGTAFHDQIGFDYGMLVGYTTMVLAFILIYFGVRAYRDNVGGGAVSFGRAFGTGMGIFAIGALCYVATWEVVYRTVASDYLEKYAAWSIEKDRKAGKPEAEIEASRKQMADMAEAYKNPLVRAGFTFLEPLPVGLLISLVSAGMLRRPARAG
jgi:hypothetical protein